MITYRIEEDGSGDFPTLNQALIQIVSDFNNYVVSDTEEFKILLGEGDFEVDNVFLAINRQIDSRILITTSEEGWMLARVRMMDQYWLLFNAVGQCVFEFSGLTIAAAGVFFRSTNNDVIFNSCTTEGYGKLAQVAEGQVSIDRVRGTPLDVEMTGNQLTAANSADGLSTTLTRMSLIVDRARLGKITTNKPVSITNCTPCLNIEYGIDAYEETTSYPASSVSRQYFERIGSLLDRIDFTKSNNGFPIAKITYGGLYRRLTFAADLKCSSFIVLDGPVHHSVCIDKCSFDNADYAIDIAGRVGEVFFGNSLLNQIAIAGAKINKDHGGWINLHNNRGLLASVPMLKYDCPIDCCQ